ncbi:MAG: adenylate/guanylate cyclase domain-containing protein [Elusimicrobiales bacterium]|jgi:class 3 adenylate cyclase|nr:adenylate/guanylate cyclase domain-containing protein [Elusimicrobiales bacterium]
MKEKSKNTGSNKRIYIATAVFSVIWFAFAGPGEITRRLDYNWHHLMLNLPLALNNTAALLGSGSKEGHRFLFGKYITKEANPKITIAAIDELTLGEYGWPVPRNYYGDLVDSLKRLGAKGIVFDVIVSASKRDKPGDNKRFVDATARAGNVVNLVARDGGSGKLIYPIKGLAEVSAIIAQPHVEESVDSDGQIRRYMPFWKDPEVPIDPDTGRVDYITYTEAKLKDTRIGRAHPDLAIPSIGVAGLSLYTGKPLSVLFMQLDERYYPEKTLNYRDFIERKKNPGWCKDEKSVTPSSYKHISFADILSGRLSAEEKEAIKDGVVLVGATAVGAFDHSPSPFHHQLPGVEVHATFLDNAIAGDFLTPSYGFMFLMLLLPWLPVFLRRYSLALLVSVCSAVLLALAAGYLFLLASGTIVSFVSVALSLFLPFAYITVDKGLAEGREKKWIKNTFGQYLSPKVVDVITKDPSKLSLGGEKRDMTAFFLDIAGFTTMSEKMPPEQLTQMLNEYLSALTEVVLKNDGVVDKYIGDCIMAFWNAPLDQKDHRKLAVLAAVDCQSEMARINRELTQFEIKPSCRIGLNSGPMVVGNMGSRTRLSYTVMGDSVNLASRLEGANKFFHSKIMASEYTFEDIKDQFDHRYLASIRVVGKAIPVKVYEPFARKGEAPAEVKEMLRHYEAGIEKFYKGDYKASIKDFKDALAALPGDGPSQYYIETAEAYAKEPPKDWDKSFNLTSKG